MLPFGLNSARKSLDTKSIKENINYSSKINMKPLLGSSSGLRWGKPLNISIDIPYMSTIAVVEQ